MKIVDLMSRDGRVFLKSEWAPISDEWPCVSFSKKSVGRRLRAEFRPGRDVLVYVGTTNVELTQDPDHCGRLLSAVVVQPNHVLETRRLVPPRAWQFSAARWGEARWPHAMSVTRAAAVVGQPLPRAKELAPVAYRSFSEIQNRGGLVEATGPERAAVLDVDVAEIQLRLSDAAARFIQIAAAVDPALDYHVRAEMTRLAGLIRNRVDRGGEPVVRVNPQRSAPNVSDLVAALMTGWLRQEGHCALCGAEIPAGTENPLLQASADRIDSDNGSYAAENVQLTHLACNWAKNEHGLPEFEEWLRAVREEE